MTQREDIPGSQGLVEIVVSYICRLKYYSCQYFTTQGFYCG